MNVNEHLWRIMRSTSKHYGGFSHLLLHEISGVSPKVVSGYLQFLLREGVIGYTDDDRFVVKRDGQCPPFGRATSHIKARQQQAIWICLRTCKALPISEIVVMTAFEDKPASSTITRVYLSDLVKAGYCRREGEKLALTRLLAAHNTGPRAPIITRNGLFDINLMKAVNVTEQQQGRAVGLLEERPSQGRAA